MRIFNGLFAMIIAVLVLALVILYPIATAVNDHLLTDTFYNENLTSAGTYDAAYDAMMSEVSKQVNDAMADDPNLDQDIANWVVDSLGTVLTREYVTDLLQQNMAGTVKYLTGEAETLPEFDLEPKYDELRGVMADGLTLDRVLTVNGLSGDGVNQDVLIAMGVIDENGTINSVMANVAMKEVFDTNEALKEPFMMKSVVDAMAYTGNENAASDLETAKKWTTLFHKGILPILLFLSFLSTLLILMNLRRIRTGLALNGWAYTLGGAITMIAGTALLVEDGWVVNRVATFVSARMAGLSGAFSLDVLIQPLGKAMASKALIFLAIGVVLLLLVGLMRKQAKQEQY
ncbi:MAG: hypothetical protein AB1Z19_00550 [Eubacteriales bacterium]